VMLNVRIGRVTAHLAALQATGLAPR
jgi:hypothetical protein